MTTVRQLITDAMRESAIISVGAVPDAEEFTESLRRFQSHFATLLGTEIGDPLTDVNFGVRSASSNATAQYYDNESHISQTYLPANSRVIFNLTAPQTVYLPPNPRDGMRVAVVDASGNFATYPLTIQGNGRHLDNALSYTVSTNHATNEWFYRGDIGRWQQVVAFTADDESPLPAIFDDYLIITLALRLNPRYNAETRQETVMELTRMRKMLRARYRQDVPISVESGLLNLTHNLNYNTGSSDTGFFTGV